MIRFFPVFLCCLVLFCLPFLGCPQPPSEQSFERIGIGDGGTEKQLDATKEMIPEESVHQEFDVPEKIQELDFKRPPNTKCKFSGSPDSLSDVKLVPAFSSLKFSFPVYLSVAPGDTKHLYVVEKEGKIQIFENNESTTNKKVFLDISSKVSTSGNEMGLLGLAFHPNYKQNGYFFVYYSSTGVHHSIVERYKVSSQDPTKADPASATLIIKIKQDFSNHNGGMLAFGPDGYLYLAPGDGGSGGDPNNRGQDLSTWLGSMLRIDVNKQAQGNNYAIPPDNPFINTPNAKPEIWAYGLRNPWRFSFDRLTGTLWAADVGQNAKEEIDIIKKGKNYGWRIMEGFSCFNPQTNCNKTGLEPPIAEYPQTFGRSITGGYVYRGSKVTSLYGHYLYGDFVSGNIWALKYDGKKVVTNKLIIASRKNVASFAEDHQGELYVVSFYEGKLYRFAQNQQQANNFPKKLSETNCFESLKPLKVVDGVIPYKVNVPLWSDSLDKERWVALPEGKKVTFDKTKPWNFPDGTVFIKHFSYEKKKGTPDSKQHVETRFLIKQGNDYRGYTYIWNQDQTDAALANGQQTVKVTQENPDSPGNSLIFDHKTPSRAECLQCHTQPASFVLGATTRQLNKPVNFQGTQINQIDLMRRLRMFSNHVPSDFQSMDKLSSFTSSDPIEKQVRSYLDANCSFCHRSGTFGTASIDLLFSTPWNKRKLCNIDPQKGDLGVAGAKLITPEKPEKSILYLRMNTRKNGKMPQIGTQLVHKEAVEKIAKWIRELKTCP